MYFVINSFQNYSNKNLHLKKLNSLNTTHQCSYITLSNYPIRGMILVWIYKHFF